MMRAILRLLAIVSMAFAPGAWATTYSSVYVFGDSLVDAGNAAIGTGGAQASPVNGFYEGRFSNGLNFADILSQKLVKKPTLAALAGGTNFSVGGADAQFKPGEISPSFLAQLVRFGQLGFKSIPSDALVLLTFGANDVRDTIKVDGTVDFTGAGDDFAKGLGALYTLGARNFLITGTPDIGLLPVSIAAVGKIPDRLAELTERSKDISALFKTKASDLDKLPGTTVAFFDFLGYERDLLADPAAYGLPADLNTTKPCQVLGGGVPQVNNCTKSLYFDAIHPTTLGHRAIATALLAALPGPVPEPATWMIMIAGVGVIGIALRRGQHIEARSALLR